MNTKYASSFVRRQDMLGDDFEIFYYDNADSYGISAHSHDFYELYCLLSGDVDILVDGRRYTPRRGSLLLIAPGELHRPEYPPPVRSVDNRDATEPASAGLAAPEPRSKDDVATPQATDAQAAPETAETKAEAAPATHALIAAPVTLPTVDVPGMPKSDVATEDKTGAVQAASTGPSASGIEIPQAIGPAALRDAAAAGDAKALFEVGSRYAEARGVREDMATAAKWYGEAAERGFAPAEYRIGNFYEKGIGVERDIAKSKEWYRRAAEKGNASAMHNLAVLFTMGADGAADNDAEHTEG